MKKNLLFLLSLLTIISLQTFGQTALQWAQRYNGPVNGTDRISDADFDPVTGNTYVTGVKYGTTSLTCLGEETLQ